MINVKIRRDEKGYIYGYIVKGHAENLNDTGDVIDCASVSMTTQFPIVGAERQLKLNAIVVTDEVAGLLDVRFPSYANLRLQTMLETMVICLKMLQEEGVLLNLEEVKNDV